MARPSKLSPEQSEQIKTRLAAGESAAALSREFGISESVISRRFSQVSQEITKVAKQIAETRIAVAALPVRDQYKAMAIADMEVEVMRNLGKAAVLASRTTVRLSELAESQIMGVDQKNPMDSADMLQGGAACLKLLNEASALPLKIAALSQSQKDGQPEDGPQLPIAVTIARKSARRVDAD